MATSGISTALARIKNQINQPALNAEEQASLTGAVEKVMLGISRPVVKRGLLNCLADVGANPEVIQLVKSRRMDKSEVKSLTTTARLEIVNKIDRPALNAAIKEVAKERPFDFLREFDKGIPRYPLFVPDESCITSIWTAYARRVGGPAGERPLQLDEAQGLLNRMVEQTQSQFTTADMAKAQIREVFKKNPLLISGTNLLEIMEASKKMKKSPTQRALMEIAKKAGTYPVGLLVSQVRSQMWKDHFQAS
jgi:hypothetical protein